MSYTSFKIGGTQVEVEYSTTEPEADYFSGGCWNPGEGGEVDLISVTYKGKELKNTLSGEIIEAIEDHCWDQRER